MPTRKKERLMKIKINKSNISKITSSNGKPVFYYDTDLIGFGIKANPTKSVYFAETRVNGKTVRKSFATVGTLTPEQARKYAQTLLGEMAKGININVEAKKEKVKSITLKDAYNDYKQTKKLRETTITGYDCAMNNAFSDWQNKELTKINRDMIEKRFKEVSEKAPAGANLYFRCLRAVFNYAIEEYCVNGEPIIPSNPCNRISALNIWNQVQPRSNYVKPSQIKMFFHSLTVDPIDSEHLATVKKQCMFILFTGARDQEAARIKRKDIDFEDRTITFENTKNHRTHILPFGEWFGNFLADLCENKQPNDYLFPANTKSGHLKDQRKTVKRISQNSGVKFSLHDLRRTFASVVENDIGLNVSEYLQNRLLNHAQNDVHGKHYVQFEVERLRPIMQSVEDYILIQAKVQEEPKAEVVNMDNVKKNA